MAWLLYVLSRDHPKDYVLLSAIKYYRHISEIVHLDTVQAVLEIPDDELREMTDRMKEKGWITISRGYVKVEAPGNREFYSIAGWVALAMDKIRKKEPISQWTRLKS